MFFIFYPGAETCKNGSIVVSKSLKSKDTFFMKKNYLNSSVMSNLRKISSQIGTAKPHSNVNRIVNWGCGGGCEGLSTPIV